MFPHFCNALVPAISTGFRHYRTQGQRILASGLVLDVFRVQDLNALSLQMADWLHRLSGDNRHHHLAHEVRGEMTARSLAPLSGPLPWGVVPCIDWQNHTIANARNFADVAGHRENPLLDLEEGFSWVTALTHGEDPVSARMHLLLSNLVPTGMGYFDGSPARSGFLSEVYRTAPAGAIHFPAAHAAFADFARGMVPAWFVDSLHDRFRSDLERAWVAATFDPTPLNDAEPLTPLERRALLAMYRGHLDVDQVCEVFADQADWASDGETTARHLHGLFVQTWRSLTR